MSSTSVTCQLIHNLEVQVQRLVQQLKDLDECKDDLSAEEIGEMKQETASQIQEFNDTLNRMTKGDLSLENKLSQMKKAIREAISKSFNTSDMIKHFGDHNANDQIEELETEFRLKRITKEERDVRKVNILTKLQAQGQSLSAHDRDFLEEMTQTEKFLERIN